MEVKRVVGLKAGLGSILYLESMRSERGSRATKVKRKALRVASMRSLRSLFFFANFSTASRCERLFQSCEFGAIDRGIRGLSVRADGDAGHSRAGRNDADDSYRRRGCVAAVLANFQTLEALVDIQSLFIFLLVRNHAFEEARFRRGDRWNR